MITVEQAEQIVLQNKADLGAEIVLYTAAAGRVLAENIKADRDLPPYNRVTMDGIAIQYAAIEQGVSSFTVIATQAAGDEPATINSIFECVEIMTGAVLPPTADTIIPYEDIELQVGIAKLKTTKIAKGQNLHYQGSDSKQGDILAIPGDPITPAVLGVIASVGEEEVRVKKLPRVIVISTGDEVVEVTALPKPFQVRRSNSHTIQAILKNNGVEAAVLHLPDNVEVIKKQLGECLAYYDAIILAGGVSMGKYDHIPAVLASLGVEQLFHKVAQRPGKPFWFGRHSNGVTVFGFPGNPVSAFMCTHRYFLPWLQATLEQATTPPIYAVLDADVTFSPALTYYLPVKLNTNEQAQLLAIPVTGNGSGDFTSLTAANAFIELPAGKDHFKKGEVYRVWPFAGQAT